MTNMNMDQIHHCCLQIAKEFDVICRNNKIPYYLLGGSMLGAIRHKGFIPWDDDMDFGVPYDYYDILVNALNRELPISYRCCTYNNHPCVFFPYIKIEDTRTIINDLSLPGPIERKIGVNIDIFPLFQCSPKDIRVKLARSLVDLEGVIYTNTRSNRKLLSVIRKVIKFLCPFSANSFANLSIAILKKAPKKPFLFNVYGRWYEKECIPEHWYGNNYYYEYEDYSFIGIKEYDLYLTKLYGSYMELPPESKRINHSASAFLR